MKLIQLLGVSLLMLIGGQGGALAAGHPADPAATAQVFRATDYFSSQSMQLAEGTHSHDTDAAPAAESHEGQGCKREGKGCCCCKCCGEGKEGAGCMKKSGEQAGAKEGCGMHKHGMQMPDKDEGMTAPDDAHEGHH